MFNLKAAASTVDSAPTASTPPNRGIPAASKLPVPEVPEFQTKSHPHVRPPKRSACLSSNGELRGTPEARTVFDIKSQILFWDKPTSLERKRSHLFPHTRTKPRRDVELRHRPPPPLPINFPSHPNHFEDAFPLPTSSLSLLSFSSSTSPHPASSLFWHSSPPYCVLRNEICTVA